MIKGMRTCGVCGRDFPLLVGEHYVAQDPQKVGAIATLVGTDRAFEYDAIDCPHCGCQNVLQERKRFSVEPSNMDDENDEEEEEEQEDNPGCHNCRCEVYPITETMQERVQLAEYCEFRSCADCKLHSPVCRCGDGAWFTSVDRHGAFQMSDKEIRDAYRRVFSE